MENQNDDRDVAENRKMPLKEASAPLRDQIPQKLFTKVKEMKLGEKISQAWSAGNNERSDWLAKQQVFLEDLNQFQESNADGPFEGSSSLHIPMPLTVMKSVHARFMQAILGIEPPFTAKARREDHVERAPVIKDVMAYALKDWANYNQGIYAAVDRWVWDWLQCGSAYLKERWDCVYQRYVDVQLVPEQGPSQFQMDAEGNQVEVPTIQMVEKEVSVTKKVFEGPVLEHVNGEDILVVGGGGDPQLADQVIHRTYLTASELWTLVDRKIFDKEDVEDVIKGGPDSEQGGVNSDIKEMRATQDGRGLNNVNELDRYEILESYMKADIDGSGINSEIVVWSHGKTNKELRATYLYRINKAGERPIFKADFHVRPGHQYGIGLLEMLHPLSVEMDALHNMRIDFGILSNTPFFFYRPTSSLSAERIEIEPGTGIPLDNPQQDVFFPQLGNRTAFGAQEEAALQTIVERVAGVNDLSLGVLTGAQGATRTATGARALLGEANANLDVYLNRLNQAWRRVLKHLLHMLQQRIPEGLSFRITGDTGSDYWRTIKNAQDISGDFDIDISPNSSNSNPLVQDETSNQVLQLLLNPLALQTGIVSPAGIYEAMKAKLKAMGVKDWGRYIQKPEGYNYIPSPEDEANRVLRGIAVPVSPQMDHQGFLQYYAEIDGNDELLGQFNEEQWMALTKQKMQHEQMLAALEQQAAQQRNQGQMRMNAAMSQQQAPMINPLSGGNSGAPETQ